MSKPLAIGAAQFDAVAGDLAANTAAHVRLIDEAGRRGIALVIFPELSLSGYAGATLDGAPETIFLARDGEALLAVGQACRRNSVVAVVGGPLPGPRGLGLSSLVIDRQGAVCATYDKQHLDSREKDWFVPGESGRIIEVDGWRLGLGICYDSSFPEHGRALACAGADAYLVSGAFPKGASDSRRTIYFPARALENTVYVAFSNYIGAHDGLEYGGRSALHGPDGQILADAGPDKEGIAIAELNSDVIRNTRESQQMLQDRRLEMPDINNHIVD